MRLFRRYRPIALSVLCTFIGLPRVLHADQGFTIVPGSYLSDTIQSGFTPFAYQTIDFWPFQYIAAQCAIQLPDGSWRASSSADAGGRVQAHIPPTSFTAIISTSTQGLVREKFSGRNDGVNASGDFYQVFTEDVEINLNTGVATLHQHTITYYPSEPLDTDVYDENATEILGLIATQSCSTSAVRFLTPQNFGDLATTWQAGADRDGDIDEVSLDLKEGWLRLSASKCDQRDREVLHHEKCSLSAALQAFEAILAR